MNDSQRSTGARPVLDDPGLPRVTPLVQRLEPSVVEFRRDIHAHPELARAEHRTSTRVAERLEAAGLTVTRLAGTGLYCDIDPVGVDGGPDLRRRRRVMLRADMDALPVAELPRWFRCGQDAR